jgi:hypothetical protein
VGRESQGNFERMVSRSDEALLMWAMDCYWNVVAVNDWKVGEMKKRLKRRSSK